MPAEFLDAFETGARWSIRPSRPLRLASRNGAQTHGSGRKPKRPGMKLLLDTCTFLWALSGRPTAAAARGDLVRNPDNDVFLSAASAWEIAIKYAAGKLPLPGVRSVTFPTMRENARHPRACHRRRIGAALSRLPSLHRDPFDRLLVSQAIVHGLTILTPDPLDLAVSGANVAGDADELSSSRLPALVCSTSSSRASPACRFTRRTSRATSTPCTAGIATPTGPKARPALRRVRAC